MKTFEIQVKKRAEVGKKSTKNLRKEGNVVCVLYGGKENVHFYAHENDFKDIVYTPNVYLVNIDIEGKKHTAVMHDLQFHPVTDKILHIDFVEVFEDRPVTIGIPVELFGNSVGVRNGGKLRIKKRQLKVSGLSKDLPDTLKIDISKINIGDTVKIKDLSFDNLTILEPERAMVVGVISSRLAAKGMAEETEETEGGEEGEAAASEEENSSES